MAKRAKKPGRPGRRGSEAARVFDTESSTDKISRYLDAKNLVPERFRGTDKFLDIVSWNIRKFEQEDPDRVEAVTAVMDALNADVFVLTEIAGDGALDNVIARLAELKAGYYSRKIGASNSEQRVAMMWDRDWVRAKELPYELFTNEQLVVPAEFGTGKQAVFPRPPMFGYFEATAAEPNDEGFTFELVGLHLKAQGPAPKGYTGPPKIWGIPQRTAAAKRLAAWLDDVDEHRDTDVIMIGDWNATPDKPEWAPFRALEAADKVAFTDINKATEVSHLVRLNASGPAGSRLDLHLVTNEAEANAVPDQSGVVIQWSPFKDLGLLDSTERKALMKGVRDIFSDHLPVVSRFYLDER